MNVIELTRKISASSRISMVPLPSMSYSLKARSRISSGRPRSVTDSACHDKPPATHSNHINPLWAHHNCRASGAGAAYAHKSSAEFVKLL